MASLLEVAQRAKVSIATVSRVLNKSDKVVPETRAAVEKALSDLGYRPSRVARRLRMNTGHAHLVGLIIPDIQNPFYAEIARGVEDAAYASEYALILCNSDESLDKERFYLDVMQAESVDGLKREFDDLGAVPEVALKTEEDIFPKVTLDELRRFERFAPYSNEDLAFLLTYCEFVAVNKDDVIIKKGDLSDAMFLVLSGQVRARLRVGGHDTLLGTMEPGELFGEIAMLSQTARTADVVADVPSRLLRLSSQNFQELMANHADLAARMLFSLARQLATRLSQRNQELYKDLASSFVWR